MPTSVVRRIAATQATALPIVVGDLFAATSVTASKAATAGAGSEP